MSPAFYFIGYEHPYFRTPAASAAAFNSSVPR
jgi:hypothetical protein